MGDGGEDKLESVGVIAAIVDVSVLLPDPGEPAPLSSSWESRLRPKAMEKMLPPSMGESETKPQFSEKCSVGRS